MGKKTSIINESSLIRHIKLHQEDFQNNTISTEQNQYTDDSDYDEESLQGDTLLHRYDTGRYVNTIETFKPKTIYVSKEYYYQTQQQLHYMQVVRRAEIIRDIQEARWYGTEETNYDLRKAVAEQDLLEKEITKLSDEFSGFVIFPECKIDYTHVSIFTQVEVKNLSTNRTQEYNIVTSVS